MSFNVISLKLKIMLPNLRQLSLPTKFFIVATLFLSTFNFQLKAQTQKDYVKNGDKLIEKYNDSYGASLWYKKALDIDSTYLDIAFKYAESLRGYNDYAKAESKYYYIYKKAR